MKVTSVKLSGCDNTLRWAIGNRADLKANMPVTSIINDESFFLVTVDGLNFYQVYRLTQLYRNRLRISAVHRSQVPSAELLADYFPGNEAKVERHLELLLGLVSQMIADDDIVYPGIPKLFLPMITTTFAVQLPFAFVDAIDVMTPDEVAEIFTDDYLRRLEALPERGAAHSLIRAIMIAVERSTGNIRYDSTYERLLQVTKYFPLKVDAERSAPYRFGLLGFSKFDPVGRTVNEVNMFRPDPDKVNAQMTGLKRISSPLELSFVIQLPIYHQQILESMFSETDLKISYRSSISNVVDNGIDLEHLYLGDDDEMIDNYRVRLTEAQLASLQLISEFTGSNDDFHPSALFSLLPPIYRTNAVITFSENRLPMFGRVDDSVLRDMFLGIIAVAAPLIDQLHA